MSCRLVLLLVWSASAARPESMSSRSTTENSPQNVKRRFFWKEFGAGYWFPNQTDCPFGETISTTKLCFKIAKENYPSEFSGKTIKDITVYKGDNEPYGCLYNGAGTLKFNKKANPTNASAMEFAKVCVDTSLFQKAKEARDLVRTIRKVQTNKRDKIPRPQVCLQPRLALAAKAHITAQTQTAQPFFSHIGRNDTRWGATPKQRMRKFGFMSTNAWPNDGECLGRGEGLTLTTVIKEGWMQRRGQKDIILDPKWTHMGYAEWGNYYALIMETEGTSGCGRNCECH